MLRFVHHVTCCSDTGDQPVFNLLYLSSTLPQAFSVSRHWSHTPPLLPFCRRVADRVSPPSGSSCLCAQSVYKEIALKGVEMDVNYLQARNLAFLFHSHTLPFLGRVPRDAAKVAL